MSGAAGTRLVATVVAGAAFVAGCAVLAAIDEHSLLAPSDASVTDVVAEGQAVTPDQSAPRPIPRVDGCDEACSCLYVDGRAAQGGDGCSSAQPLSTIGAALDAARLRAARAPVRQVVICRGVYSENLRLDMPVSLRGGFDCSTWTADPTADFPGLTSIHTDLVSARLASGNENALEVFGGAVDGTVEITGLRISGAIEPNVTADSHAVLIRSGASPRFHDNEVVGGASKSPNGTAGIFVQSGAKPEIFRNIVRGGSGTSTDPFQAGSTGVFVDLRDGTDPDIHDNEIEGGTGRADTLRGYGSIGLRIGNGRLSAPLTRNVFKGGRGTAPARDAATGDVSTASTGVFVTNGTTLTLRDNVIEAGSGTAWGPGASTDAGVEEVPRPGHFTTVALSVVGPSGPIVVEGNRIRGGRAENTVQLASAAVYLASGSNNELTSFQLTNNFIAGPDGVGVGGYRYAATVRVHRSGLMAVRHNTLYAPAAFVRAVNLALEAPNVAGRRADVIVNNLLVGRGGLQARERALSLGHCTLTPAAIRAFENNGFIGAGALVSEECGTAMNLTDLEQYLAANGASHVGGNLVARPVCEPAETGCLVQSCPTPATCGAALFDAWTDGYRELAAGWKLKSTGACVVAADGRPLLDADAGIVAVGAADGAVFALPPVVKDGLGLTRDVPVSRGAHELVGPCVP